MDSFTIHSWQDALWYLPNAAGCWWDVSIGALAIITAFIGFAKLILNHRFDALLVARSLVYGGFFLIGANMFNTGWTKYAMAVLVMGGFLSTMLIVTNWCDRPDKNLTIPRALWRWTAHHILVIIGSLRHDGRGASHTQ